MWYTNKSHFIRNICIEVRADFCGVYLFLVLLSAELHTPEHRNFEIVRAQADPQYFRRNHQSVKNTTEVLCEFVMNGLISCCKVQTLGPIQSFG